MLAKLAEHFDAQIYSAISFSGHSIKHLLSGLAVLFAVKALFAPAPPRTHSA